MTSLLASPVLLAACTSNCENAGVAVDDKGNIVVRGEDGFISPNSLILRSVSRWPQPPSEEQSFAFSQGYTLTNDGAIYLLKNTAQHPNLVYRVDLASGAASIIGSGSTARLPLSSTASLPLSDALSKSKETWIAANERYVYSVDQIDAAISRGILSSEHPTLSTFIAGARTQLKSPIAIAVDKTGRVCALDGETNSILCYAADRSGDVAPETAINLKQLLGYDVVLSMTLDHAGRVVVSGARNSNGFSDSAIAVIDLSHHTPEVVRTISGPHSGLLAPELGVDANGNILALQQDAPMIPSNSEVLAFGPQQKGNVAPQSIRKPSATVTHPFRIAVEPRTGDVAILGSDGIAVFHGAARHDPTQWPPETRLAVRGWSVAFGAGSLVVADKFGGVQTLKVGRSTPTAAGENDSLNLDDPEFIATDQDGTIFAASTGGVITRFPKDSASESGWKRTFFATTFGRNMNAFAPDSSGHFYLSSASNNAILTVDADGKQGVLTGEKTELSHPLGLAVNRAGALYVANSGTNEILVFARGSSGDVAPIARIAGAATQLVEPQALAVDASGRLYVFDGPQNTGAFGAMHHVHVYGARAYGNVAPIETYDVRTKCWANAV